MQTRPQFLRWLAGMTVGTPWLHAASALRDGQPALVEVEKVAWQGWDEVWRLRNAAAEVLVVPGVARIMEFKMRGAADGPFWHRSELLGKQREAAVKTWQNYGGDKCWPAPQKEWPQQQQHGWPPPVEFDNGPATVVPGAGALSMELPAGDCWGLEVRRTIRLHASAAECTVETEFRKLRGAPVAVSIWVVTQLRDPMLVGAGLGKTPLGNSGYVKLMSEEAGELVVGAGRLQLTRRRDKAAKVGTAGRVLAWVGERETLRIVGEGTAATREVYPDGGARSEIYTSADPLAYVELETLSPLRTLSVGESMRWMNTYTLAKRAMDDPRQELRALLGDGV